MLKFDARKVPGGAASLRYNISRTVGETLIVDQVLDEKPTCPDRR